MSDIGEIKRDIQSIKDSNNKTEQAVIGLTDKMTELTEVLIRKEEKDKHLEIRVDKLEEVNEKYEDRIRATEDYITKANPWISLASKVLAGLCLLGAALYFGLK